MQGLLGYPVVYILPPSGALPPGVPELCYFDPGDTYTSTLGAGGVDLALANKYTGAAQEQRRLHVPLSRGKGYTILLTGTVTDPTYFSFIDP